METNTRDLIDRMSQCSSPKQAITLAAQFVYLHRPTRYKPTTIVAQFARAFMAIVDAEN